MRVGSQGATREAEKGRGVSFLCVNFAYNFLKLLNIIAELYD